MEEIRDDATWDWLIFRKGDLKKETEGMITAAQDQALRTNNIKAKVEKQNQSPLCSRICGEKDESMGHLVGECSKLAQTEYKHRHDNVARMIHWNIAHSYGLDVSNKWYEHKPEGVIENDHVKLLWDFNIQTSTYIQARRPDMVVVDRDKKTCNIIDVAVPVDAGIVEKEKEKVEKYQDLRREVARIWNVKAKVVPIVVGVLGAVTSNLSKHLDAIGVTTRIELLQKAALLATARLLRQVLESRVY
ncbi:uncharacterized protein [Montipora capricornis]|uniref:uncharacterized protein n=1 Tax=Montipora capricornis TaxID=246305 RepID=UPI0035F180A2